MILLDLLSFVLILVVLAAAFGGFFFPVEGSRSIVIFFNKDESWRDSLTEV